MRYIVLAGSLVFAPQGAAIACSIGPDPRPVEVQKNEWASQSYLRSEAMAEVVAVSSSRSGRPGKMRVLRVLKGPLEPGQVLTLHPVDSGMCGAGDFKKGSKGLILIDRLTPRPIFKGYLPRDYLTRLTRLGLWHQDAPSP